MVSYDLVSDGEYVIEADVSGRIPLPGSEGCGREKAVGSAQVVDVVVCALSLMGTNWPMCLREAWRILKPESVFFPAFAVRSPLNPTGAGENSKLLKLRAVLLTSKSSKTW